MYISEMIKNYCTEVSNLLAKAGIKSNDKIIYYFDDFFKEKATRTRSHDDIIQGFIKNHEHHVLFGVSRNSTENNFNIKTHSTILGRDNLTAKLRSTNMININLEVSIMVVSMNLAEVFEELYYTEIFRRLERLEYEVNGIPVHVSLEHEPVINFGSMGHDEAVSGMGILTYSLILTGQVLSPIADYKPLVKTIGVGTITDEHDGDGSVLYMRDIEESKIEEISEDKFLPSHNP